MHLEGSCDCQRVRFHCEADGPVPFMRCYCSICRKTGSGGFMINLLARAGSLVVEGEAHVKVYRAAREQEDGTVQPSAHARHFCGECGSHLWAHHDRWPELLHPVASAIDTPLPVAPSHTHIFLRSKPAWVPLPEVDGDRHFERYPDASLRAWHEARGLYEGETD